MKPGTVVTHRDGSLGVVRENVSYGFRILWVLDAKPNSSSISTTTETLESGSITVIGELDEPTQTIRHAASDTTERAEG